ncbi:MAG: hypothetical protein SAK29_41245 [Scytonema sp. PMC 1069.18]|nr:hypothetical protein [Scytonema sp. PMC 1069.18]MEC4887456.1 hypothetical protein [Scytonema sp. PMC 1070.18]
MVSKTLYFRSAIAHPSARTNHELRSLERTLMHPHNYPLKVHSPAFLT